MSSNPTVEELREELAAAYDLLLHALPLAVRLMKTTIVPFEDMNWFFGSLTELANAAHIDALKPDGELEEDEDGEHMLRVRQEMLLQLNKQHREGKGQ